MKRLLPLELAGLKELEYDLLDEKGTVLYPKGTALSRGLLMKLVYMKLYRKEASVQPKILNEKLKPAKSIMKEHTKELLMNNTRSILQNAYDGKPIRLEDCVSSTKVILDEVSEALGKITCINELRVYDEYTYSHNVNVSSLSVALGFNLKLDENELKELALGAFLHDIGKMKIPKEILNKPGRLVDRERNIIEKHTILGYKYIKENFEVSDKIARVSLDHHEKYEGNGYPNGLRHRLINSYAQIVSVMDVYDALVSDRVYKKGIPAPKALQIMETSFTGAFNPDFFAKFLILTDAEELKKISE